MLSDKRFGAGVPVHPTTSQPYAFPHIFSVHPSHIHGVAHRLGDHDRLSGVEDISRSLGCPDRRMVMFSDHPQHVLETIVDMGYTDPSVRDDFPMCAWSYNRLMSSFQYQKRSIR